MKKFFILIPIFFLLTACNQKQKETHINGSTMGTYYSIKYVTQNKTISAADLKANIDKRLLKINQQMSTFIPNSELSIFNQSTKDTPIKVSAATLKVISEAIKINRLTLGGLDITVGPIVNLWGFGPNHKPEKIPSNAKIASTLKNIGIDKLTIKNNFLIKSNSKLYVDLSSIAKGYGVDEIALYLESLNIDNYLVEIGGELKVKGKNGQNKLWKIAIEKPVANLQSVQKIIVPKNMGVATSGDYRNYFEENGTRYSHTINPKTGRPITNHVVSVTVIARSCMQADGLATGFNVLGGEKSLNIANSLNIAIYLIEKTPAGFKEFISNDFKQYLMD